MAFFEKALKAKVMSTHLLIRANVSKTILLQAFKIATDFEDRYSAYKPDSFLNTINQHAGISSVPCTLADMHLFHTAMHASKETHGLFDISIGALSHGAYHFGFANQQIVSNKDLKHIQSLVNYHNIVLSDQTIYLKHKGMRLDLGGIGKGYVAKQIALFLAQHGATKILVDVGGEIVTRGKSYTIAIKDPFREGNIAYIKTTKEDTSISTSGSYERFIDKKHHHILDTHKGVSNPYYSAMTILQNSWHIDMLDAYATALFNQPESQLSALSSTLNIALIAIDTQQKIIQKNMNTFTLKSLQFL